METMSLAFNHCSCLNKRKRGLCIDIGNALCISSYLCVDVNDGDNTREHHSSISQYFGGNKCMEGIANDSCRFSFPVGFKRTSMI